MLIDVEDHCGGLLPSEAETMFLPFTQSGQNKTGLGLGLSLSRRSVEANKGTLTVRAVPGSGCVFTIDLPPSLHGGISHGLAAAQSASLGRAPHRRIRRNFLDALQRSSVLAAASAVLILRNSVLELRSCLSDNREVIAPVLEQAALLLSV